IAASTDGSGCPPDAVSRTARKIKYAPSVVASLAMTKLLTKFETSDWNEFSHDVPIPPPGTGTLIPNELNQLSSGVKVRKTTDQNIHLVKPPPIRKLVPPSRRRLIPARTSETSAAGVASRSRVLMTSFKSCGTATVFSRLLSTQEIWGSVWLKILAGSPTCLP